MSLLYLCRSTKHTQWVKQLLYAEGDTFYINCMLDRVTSFTNSFLCFTSNFFVMFCQLLNYATTTLMFSDKKVDSNVITWNRLILLHGKILVVFFFVYDCPAVLLGLFLLWVSREVLCKMEVEISLMWGGG